MGYVGNSMPPEIHDLMCEYRLCRAFGVLPSQLDNEDASKIDLFLTIMSLENERSNKLAKQSHGN